MLVALFAFILMHLIPGSPAVVMLGDEATPETIAQLEKEMGIDKPIYVQFQIWFFKLLQGDLGGSIFFDRPVLDLILGAMGPSLLLAVLSLGISLVIGICAGVIAAVKRNSWIDQVSLTSALLGASIPSFWLGLTLILLFSVKIQIFPTSGYQSILDSGDITNIKYLILPALALGLPSSALITRLTRSAMLDVLGKDYVNTARAKGLRERSVILKHALRNAAIPVVTVTSFTFMNILSRAVVTESIFRIPGLGSLIVTSIMRRDYPTIQGILLVIAGMYIAINLITDLTYTLIDPRIRLGK
jgi:peptide/nickel transport system permease protein|tara:strand:+ start:139 stop:1041 length:903 start_codon:yes stop_codon:yes gene_type:complete